jgi:outer membrane protein, multidrug efflux system
MRNVHFSLAPRLLLSGLLAACTVGPDYVPPKMAMPVSFAGAMPAREADLARWWAGFDDNTLNTLIDRALHDNLDLQTALSRIREAREQEIVVGAAAWPTLAADPQFTHTRLSQNAISLTGLGVLAGGAPTSGIGSFGIPGTSFNTFQLGFDASWELDLFGRTRRSVEAARDTTEADVWSHRDTEVSLIAEVADTYLAYRTARRRLLINRRELQRQQGLLNLLRTRSISGLATDLDMRQQEISVAATAASQAPFVADAQTRLHALGTLLGKPPEALLGTLLDAILPEPPEVPVGLPSDLLRRRPDIRAAERQLAAATANIGVAVADYYPDVTLTASPALISTALSTLLNWASRNLSAGTALNWSLFNGGKTKANVAVMDEQERQAMLDYQKTVLTALQEVEDALSRYAADRAQQQEQARQSASARVADGLSRTQYRAGLVPFSNVLTTEAALLSAEDAAAQTDAKTAQDVVALYKALGGGWDTHDTATEQAER